MTTQNNGSAQVDNEEQNTAGLSPPASDARTSADLLYRMPLSLRWRDLDAFNHVNNATFMTYLEEARIRWFDTLGGDWVTEAVAPLLAAVHMNYRQPISYPANVVVEMRCERAGNTSLTIGHRILADGAITMGGEPALHADGKVVIVWIDRASGRPCPLPEMIRKAVES